MAFSLRPSGQLSFVMVDETGTTSKVVIHFPSSQLASIVQTNALTLAPLIEAISGCAVKGVSYSYELVDPVYAAPAAGSRVEDKGRFLWALANGLTTKIEIPGIDPTTVLPDGAIDTANSDVTAFLDAIVLGSAYSGIDGSDIARVTAAYQAFRRSTKGMLPTRRLA